MWTGGGGGHGPAAERSAALRAADTRLAGLPTIP
jgi:hypothetical protein